MSTLHEDRYACFIISRSFLLGMRKFSDKFVEKIKTHVLCSVTYFFFLENRPVYEIMRKSLVAHVHCMLDTYGCKYTHI